MTIQAPPNLTQNTQNPVGAGRMRGSEYFEDDLRRADRLLDELRAADVWLWVEGDRLAFDAPDGVLTNARLAELRAAREALLAILRGPSEPPAAPDPRACGAHLLPFDAIETTDPSRGGWVRMTCRRCGRFLGYSPREASIL